MHIAAPRRNALDRKVRDGEGTIASTRGACAPQKKLQRRAYNLLLAKNDSRFRQIVGR